MKRSGHSPAAARIADWEPFAATVVIIAPMMASATYRNPYEAAAGNCIVAALAGLSYIHWRGWPAWLIHDPTVVYRLYGTGGALLYIGLTRGFEERMYNHSLNKTWWSEVARTETRLYLTRVRAARAEHAAILAESPRYNVQRLTLAAHLRAAGVR